MALSAVTETRQARPWVAHKFGGTSVADAERDRLRVGERVADRVRVAATDLDRDTEAVRATDREPDRERVAEAATVRDAERERDAVRDAVGDRAVERVGERLAVVDGDTVRVGQASAPSANVWLNCTPASVRVASVLPKASSTRNLWPAMRVHEASLRFHTVTDASATGVTRSTCTNSRGSCAPEM
jgi:hypothetical protein